MGIFVSSLSSFVFVVSILAAVGGCDDAVEPSASAATKPSTAPEPSAGPEPPTEKSKPASEWDEPHPDQPLGARMREARQRFAAELEPGSAFSFGHLETGKAQDYQVVFPAGRCFRVIAVGDEDVRDLDLLLFDPRGVQVQQDASPDSTPVLGLAHPICPERPGAYRVQVRMVQGSGAYATQTFRTRLR